MSGMYGFLEALESLIKASAEGKRNELANALETYADDFPEEFEWAVGGQSPALLHHLMMIIDLASHPAKPGRVIKLVDREPPEGSA
jgi:hypothetical protein